MTVHSVNQLASLVHQGRLNSYDVIGNSAGAKNRVFSQELNSARAMQMLQKAANNSGLTDLAKADDPAQWHSLMSQTYGYDKNNEESELYQNSETLRQLVGEENWSELDIDVTKTTQGNLAGPAVFVGGDTATASDDQILIDPKQEGLGVALTEELFHVFERKINPDQIGDTRLVNNQPTFTDNASAAALDEGELARALLNEYKTQGAVPTLNSELLTSGGINQDDTSQLSLNGTPVSVEHVTSDEKLTEVQTVLDEIGEGYAPLIVPELTQYIFTDFTSASDVNSLLTNERAKEYNADGSRDYSFMEQSYQYAYDQALEADDEGWGHPVDILLANFDLFPENTFAQGTQDYLGWIEQSGLLEDSEWISKFDTYGPDIESALHGFSFADLDGYGSSEIDLEPEAMKWMSPSSLLSLLDQTPVTTSENNYDLDVGHRVASTDVQESLQARYEVDPDTVTEAVYAVVHEAGGFSSYIEQFTPYELSNFAPLWSELYETSDSWAGRQLSTDAYQAGDYAWFAAEAYNSTDVIPDSHESLDNRGGTFEVVAVSGDSSLYDANTWTMWQNDITEEVVVAFQGTNAPNPLTSGTISIESDGDWGDVLRDLQSVVLENATQHADDVPLDVAIGGGWLERWLNQKDSINTAIEDLNILGTPEINFVGHSLGAATAQTAGYLYSKDNPDHLVNVEAYNAPRTGNQALADDYQAMKSSARGWPSDTGHHFTSNTYNITGDPVSWVRLPFGGAVHADDVTQYDRRAYVTAWTNHNVDSWDTEGYLINNAMEVDDTASTDEYLTAAATATVDEIDDLMAGDIIENTDGSRNYSDMETLYEQILTDTDGSLTDWITELPVENFASQGVQDFLGWAVINGHLTSDELSPAQEYVEGTDGNRFLLDITPETVAQLNAMSQEALNYEVHGAYINKEFLAGFDAGDLLNLNDKRSATKAVQEALGTKIQPSSSDGYDTDGVANVTTAIEALGWDTLYDSWDALDMTYMDERFLDVFVGLQSSGIGSISAGQVSAQLAVDQALDVINPISIKTNYEYGGVVYYNNLHGLYYVTQPVMGTRDYTPIEDAQQTVADTANWQEVGLYHTHGGFMTASPDDNGVPTDDASLDYTNGHSTWHSAPDLYAAFESYHDEDFVGVDYLSFIGSPDGSYRIYNPWVDGVEQAGQATLNEDNYAEGDLAGTITTYNPDTQEILDIRDVEWHQWNTYENAVIDPVEGTITNVTAHKSPVVYTDSAEPVLGGD